MRHVLTFSFSTVFAALSAIGYGILTSGVAHALDKVDTYICPTMHKGSGTDCFLEAIPQTYTMCRHIKSIEVIEFGLVGAQEGVNGAKTESCIDKHKLSMARPYQAALVQAEGTLARDQALLANSKIDLDRLRGLWSAVSPMSYFKQFARWSKKSLIVYAKYDLTFLPELSREVVDEFARYGLDHKVVVLPCGHYTTGETPFKYMDGWHLASFFRTAFESL